MTDESTNKTRTKRISARKENMKITIESNKTLLDILDDKRKVLKLVTIIVVLVLTIFIGLAFVTVTVKSVYPYNIIRVNTFGTTTMESENKEINYWLFNTAELWANSGIRVEKGDILTIRSSGKFNTAIHHMVNAANDNYKFTSGWIGPDGHQKESVRDSYRAKYRLRKNETADALIMQVVPIGKDVFKDTLYTSNKNNVDNIYFIGKERIDLHISETGILHFAVNDIVLTEKVINAMMHENDSLIRAALGSEVTHIDSLWGEKNKEFFAFGKTPGGKCNNIENEMTYYLNDAVAKHKDVNATPSDNINTYYNAWYDDNLGSFLIVVERKKH